MLNHRRSRGLFALMLVALVVAAGAHASVQLSDRQLSAMSARELHVRRAQPAHVVAFFAHHRWLLASRHPSCWSHVPWSTACNRARIAQHAARLQLAAIDRRLGRIAALARARAAANAWPAHHSLWLCIHSHEAADWQNPNTGGNGHYGGLQMHPGWGYGTSYLASNDSQMTQERAAEAGYRASNWSRAWLLGQWFHPDCLAYA